VTHHVVPVEIIKAFAEHVILVSTVLHQLYLVYV